MFSFIFRVLSAESLLPQDLLLHRIGQIPAAVVRPQVDDQVGEQQVCHRHRQGQGIVKDPGGGVADQQVFAVLHRRGGDAVGDGQQLRPARDGVFGDAAQRIIVLWKGDEDDQILRRHHFQLLLGVVEAAQVDDLRVKVEQPPKTPTAHGRCRAHR